MRSELVRQLEEIENRLAELKEEAKELEKARTNIINELYSGSNALLKKLPELARKNLDRLGIDTDAQLKLFLHGQIDLSIIRVSEWSVLFNEDCYKKATNAIERLKSIRGIGIGTAKKVLSIVEEEA